MCSTHPTRKHCTTCGAHFATESNRIKHCLEFKLKGFCTVGITQRHSWTDYYQDQCARCIDEEHKKEEERRAMEVEKEKAKQRLKGKLNCNGHAGMETILEDTE